MANTSGKAYGLTLLCPITCDEGGNSCSDATRDYLEALPIHAQSPMAKVPNTYLCRFYVLDDVIFQGNPAKEEHLKSRYLVFCANFHGDLDNWLTGMWNAIPGAIGDIWHHCVAFNKVKTAQDFIAYIKKCQVTNTLYFNGSTDDSLDEQLKSLYLKQEFSRFVFDHYGRSAAEIQAAFRDFVAVTRPSDLTGPTWQPGMTEEKPQHHYSYHLSSPARPQ